MHDLILFSQQQPYRSFAERAEYVRQRKPSQQVQQHINVKNFELPLTDPNREATEQFVKRFQSKFKLFIASQPQLDTNALLQEFRKEPFLQELAQVVDLQLGEQNQRLREELSTQREHLARLGEQLELHTKREDSHPAVSSHAQTRNNFNAINPDGNLELSRSLYEKARSATLPEFHELVSSYFLKQKVKVTGVKQWPHSKEGQGEQTARTVIQEAIEEVKNTLGKAQPKYSSEYLANMLQEHFVGRREKFQLVSKMLTNQTILRYLEDMFESGGVPCPQPCCMLRGKEKHSMSAAITPKVSTRYIHAVKRSSDICYKSDQVTHYMDRFRSSMRDRNAQEQDIRSISKTNLEQTESFEKLFNKQQTRRKKLEYRERQRMDNTLRDFIKSIK